jgi:hypothetical protein
MNLCYIWPSFSTDSRFPRHIQVYLSLLAKAYRPPPRDPEDYSEVETPEFDKDHVLVTGPRMQKGLEILRRERASKARG